MIWNFVAQVAIAVVLSAISYYLTPRPEDQNRPTDLEDFDFPTAEEGRAISVLYGKRHLSGPNVVWYGNLKVKSIKDSGNTIGYRYFVGVHMVICEKIDAILSVFVGDKLLQEKTISSSQTESYDQSDLFGGDKKGGGIAGKVDYMFGEATQTPNSYLTRVQAAVIQPAYRNVVSAVLNQAYLGTSSQVKPWSFVCEHYPEINGFTTAYKRINDDSNPVYIILDLLTSSDHGIGLSLSLDIDEQNFESVAETLSNVGFGLSFVWTSDRSIEDFIQDVLNHIDATLYTARDTGKFTLKLIRDDYVVDNLPVFNENNILSVDNYGRAALGEQVNQVILHYNDQNAFKDKKSSVVVHNLALFQSQPHYVTSEVDYAGISNSTLANTVANRELTQLSSSLAMLQITCNRDAWVLNPGDAFVFQWADYGIQQLIFRVTGIDYGAIDKGEIVIDATEDIFAARANVYSDPPLTDWVPPTNAPVDVAALTVFESPYAFWIFRNGDGFVTSNEDNATIDIVAFPPTDDSADFTTWINTPALTDYAQNAVVDFGINFVMSNNFAPDETLLEFDLLPAGLTVDYVDRFLMINDELMQITAFNEVGQTMTVARGIYDTRPRNITAGDIAYYIDISQQRALDGVYVSPVSIFVKLLTNASLGQLAIDDATEQSIALDSRFAKPYAPANFRINGHYYPSDPINVTGSVMSEWTTLSSVTALQDGPNDVVFTWAERNRLTQGRVAYSDSDASSFAPETNTTYQIEIRNNSTNALLRQETGLTGTTWTWPANDIEGDVGGVTDLRAEITAFRDAYESHQKNIVEFTIN